VLRGEAVGLQHESGLSWAELAEWDEAPRDEG
jgi:hypothetical protein